MASKSPLKTRDDLSMAYTPGVARVCTRDRRGPEQGLEPDDQAEHGRRRQRRHGGARARRHRPRGGDAGDGGQGDAVQGVRRRRRVADLPRDEGRRRDRRRRRRRSRPASAASTSRTSRRRAASRSRAGCKETLDIPVFHDDQHGTAIVVIAAFLNALRVVGKRPEDVRVVLTGVGAAGVATTDMLLARRRARHHRLRPAGRDPPRPRPTSARGRRAFAERTNPEGFAGIGRRGARRRRRLHRPLGPGRGHAATAIATMADGAIVFAMANPTPEIAAGGDRGPRRGRRDRPLRLPEPDQQRARVPGRLPRRARRARVDDQRGDEARRRRGDRRGRQAGRARARSTSIPSVFNRDVAPAVAAAVAAAAEATGVARRRHTPAQISGS